jgi:DNA-binding CsgD family transcriptional regulator
MATDPERRLRRILAIVLVVVFAAGTGDLVLDAPDHWLSMHVAYEVALVVGSAIGAAVLWREWWRAEHMLAETRLALDAREAERDRWRTSAQAALAGFARAMDDQFSAWHLTPAERDVALHLLKGRSHKEIAFTTGRSERTVRQHAVSVYDKSGLGGRAELAAFFLEDVMLPTGT